MRTSRSIVAASVLALFAVSAVLVIAEEKSGQPAPSKEQAAMMEAFARLGTPGPQHAKIKSMAGQFNADCSMQMDPSAPAEKSKGTASNQMLYDGRYLKGDFNGTFMGAPFSGTCLIGFDNQKQKYQMLWFDSMSTMMMLTEGTPDASGNTITFPTECQDPVTNQKMIGRQVLTLVDANHHTVEAYQMKDGKEFKCMTITYTRAQ